MFAPIKARDASSFSKNGIQAVATDTICFGDVANLTAVVTPNTTSVS
jgi:hypothetical protein